MFDFHEKRKIRGLLFSKVTIAALFILLAFLSVSVFERFKVEREMAAKRANKEAELIELRARASVLESKVRHLKESRGVEEELRGRFDVAKEGEEVVIIVGETPKEPDLDTLGIPPGAEEREGVEKTSWFDIFKFW